MILLERLKSQIDPFLAEEQAGFRRERSTTQQILILRLLAEKASRKNRKIHNCFVDFRKAFDTSIHDLIWATLRSYGVEEGLIDLLKMIYSDAKAAVRIGGNLGEWFHQEKGTRQGDPISPIIFTIYLERILEHLSDEDQGGLSVHGYKITNLRYADDIDLVSTSSEQLQQSLDEVTKRANKAGLKVNVGKTKYMTFGEQHPPTPIKVEDKEVDTVEEFEYLGSLITWDNDCSKEIKRRIGKAYGALSGFNKLWNSKAISLGTKIKVLRACVFSILLYACETWTLKKTDVTKLNAFEMKCYRRLLNIRWFHRISNDEVWQRVSMEDSTKKNIVQTVMQRKLRFFGHICRMPDHRLIKTTIFGIIEGNNKRGRPKREWLDDIKEWCQKSVWQTKTIAMDRDKWRKFVDASIDTHGT